MKRVAEYKGVVLNDGHLSLPKEIKHCLGIQPKESLMIKISMESGAEPEAFVKVYPDMISFETLKENLIDILCQFSEDLKANEITVRYEVTGKIGELAIEKRKFRGVLEDIKEILYNESVIIEIGENTIYSNGGGCILLELTSNRVVRKRQIVKNFMKIVGFKVNVKTDNFTAWVKDGKLRVLEE